MENIQLLNLFIIITLNNIVSIIIYEILEDSIHTPLIIKFIWFFTVIISLSVWTVFFLKLCEYINTIYLNILDKYNF